MQKILKPEVRLHIEGSSHRIMMALDKAGMKKAADDFMDTKSRMFEDDPDGGDIGYVKVGSFAEVCQVVRAMSKDCSVTLEAQAGDDSAGFVFSMDGVPGRGRDDAFGLWKADDVGLSSIAVAAAKRAIKVLEDVV